jgi:hypothetical protein
MALVHRFHCAATIIALRGAAPTPMRRTLLDPIEIGSASRATRMPAPSDGVVTFMKRMTDIRTQNFYSGRQDAILRSVSSTLPRMD